MRYLNDNFESLRKKNESQKIPDRVGDSKRPILVGLTTNAESLADFRNDDVENRKRKKRYDDRTKVAGNQRSNGRESVAGHGIKRTSKSHGLKRSRLKHLRHVVARPTTYTEGAYVSSFLNNCNALAFIIQFFLSGFESKMANFRSLSISIFAFSKSSRFKCSGISS